MLVGIDKSSAEHAASLSFSEEGMTVPAGGGKAEFVPYREFECAVETADSFLFVFADFKECLPFYFNLSDLFAELSRIAQAGVCI